MNETMTLQKIQPLLCDATASSTPARRAEVRPLAPEHYKVQFTVSGETRELLLEAQQLLRHRIHNGDVGDIFKRALELLVTELRRTKHAAVGRERRSQAPHGHSRHIPAAVKREVWARDEGQCAFVGPVGRCTERGFLEYHHVVPFADGGEATAFNIELRCRAHNVFEDERWSGMSEDELTHRLVTERVEADRIETLSQIALRHQPSGWLSGPRTSRCTRSRTSTG